MKQLVPVKVKIGLKQNRHHDYPNFNKLNCVKESGLDWSVYVDVQGLEWHYDKKCGHKEYEINSPLGMQWGVLIIPKIFAEEALVMFPDLVTKLDEMELEDFYDNRAHAHEPDNKTDKEALKEFTVKIEAGEVLSQEDRARFDKALDPNDDTPGIKKNFKKKWIDFKTVVEVEIVQ
jgi:hypothetical protein